MALATQAGGIGRNGLTSLQTSFLPSFPPSLLFVLGWCRRMKPSLPSSSSSFLFRSRNKRSQGLLPPFLLLIRSKEEGDLTFLSPSFPFCRRRRERARERGGRKEGAFILSSFLYFGKEARPRPRRKEGKDGRRETRPSGIVVVRPAARIKNSKVFRSASPPSYYNRTELCCTVLCCPACAV